MCMYVCIHHLKKKHNPGCVTLDSVIMNLGVSNDASVFLKGGNQ